ncbi:NAD(+)/NADH kinase [Candidatus Woesearchaeota archaeon]|nr:NAD(+)/NADH kinase [Candidatus Woesearchaeota archaeon]
MKILVVQKPIKYGSSVEEQEETYQVIDNALSNFDCEFDTIQRKNLTKTDEYDLVIATGGDGTVLTTSHYTQGTPIWGINSNVPESFGFYCSSDKNNFAEHLKNYEGLPRTKVQRLVSTLNGNELIPALNDIFVSLKRQHGMCDTIVDDGRYICKNYKCTGLLVATYTGRYARMKKVKGEVNRNDEELIEFVPIEDDDKKSRYTESLRVISNRDNNLISIDGCHNFYDFNMGDRLEIELGQEIEIIGNLERKFYF